jgi:phage terminase large subunit-like protein
LEALVGHEQRWRPEGRGPECRYAFRGQPCPESGAHYCAPRADRVVAFFAELLRHTKGPYARTAFLLASWEEHEIVRPLFGEVVWSVEWGCYVRRYRVAYIIMARKNGKSELAAGILLYLLVGDDEQAAEVYSAAKDTKQAGKVFEPALRMVQLSPALSARLRYYKHARRT